jgi:hypothetical protein
MVSFLWMVGSEVVSHDWLGIGKGSFSDSHISADGSHAGSENTFYIFQLSIGYVLGTEEFVSFASPTNRYLTVFR